VLAEIKGLSEAKIQKMVDACRKMCSAFGFRTAKELGTVRARDIGAPRRLATCLARHCC
jgi:hypothetical protein